MVFLASTVVLALLSSQPAAQSVQTRETPVAREVMLTLPHALRQGETAWLLVEVGAMNGDQILLTTQDGKPLGMISPYGTRSDQTTGTYTVPVPADAFHNGRVALRLSVSQASGAQRAPTADEVNSVRLTIRRLGAGS
jgi:hypothetical protein